MVAADIVEINVDAARAAVELHGVRDDPVEDVVVLLRAVGGAHIGGDADQLGAGHLGPQGLQRLAHAPLGPPVHHGRGPRPGQPGGDGTG